MSATCGHCSFIVRALCDGSTFEMARQHEATNHGHTVTVWDGPTSQIPRSMWTSVLGDDATAAAAETKRATEDVTVALVRLVIDHAGSGDPEDAYEVTVFTAAEKAGIDLHAALAAHFERGEGK